MQHSFKAKVAFAPDPMSLQMALTHYPCSLIGLNTVHGRTRPVNTFVVFWTPVNTARVNNTCDTQVTKMAREHGWHFLTFVFTGRVHGPWAQLTRVVCTELKVSFTSPRQTRTGLTLTGSSQFLNMFRTCSFLFCRGNENGP